MTQKEYLAERDIIERAQEIARRQRELLDDLDALLDEVVHKESADGPEHP